MNTGMKPGRHIVTFGEIMMRLSPPGNRRLRQAHSLDIHFGGAEANVAVALANYGLPVQYITRLPENELGLSCLQSIRKHGVGCEFIEISGNRLGLYFVEVGTNNRPSQVIYDRAGSSFANVEESTFNWGKVFANASWFHWSGISPAVSASAATVTAQAIDAARDAGLKISCDLNYRQTLWQWGESPSTVMPQLIEKCDVLAANAAQVMLGLPDFPEGRNVDEIKEACIQLSRLYPNLKQIAMSFKEDSPGAEQRFSAVMWHQDQLYTSPSFPLTSIVDRIGAGDAFMAGLIYGLVTFPDDPQRVVNLATASGVIKYSVVGDASLMAVEEVERLLGSRPVFDIIR